VAITLGKDCAITLGSNIASARSVTISASAKTIDINAYGSRLSEVYSVGYDGTVSIELNDSADSNGAFTSCETGSQVIVSGGSGGWSFTAVVTGVSETFSVDGVATLTIEAKMTRSGLRV
jgi:hypothetical protein